MFNLKLNKIIIICFLVFLFSGFFVFKLQAAQNAIGIRVARNAEHLSPSTWYNRFAPNWYGTAGGGPSVIDLAGYEAVSVGSCSGGSGETIYVNAANEVGGDLYTNMYIISCPVNADPDTVDIFEQLLTNWNFNVNVLDETERAKLQRDVKRLSDMNTLRDIIENYRLNIDKTNRYPKLASGTYLIGESLSYWPSWQKTLGTEVQATLPVPPDAGVWGPTQNLIDWHDQDSKPTWPTDKLFPDSVGINFSTDQPITGCRQVVALKNQKITSWCEGNCTNCQTPPISTAVNDTTNITWWPNGINDPAAISYTKTPAGCHEVFAIQDNNKFILRDQNQNPCLNNDTVAPVLNYDQSWPAELQNPTAIGRGFDYNQCEHILVIKDNRWSEFTTGTNCTFAGWTPVTDLTITPDTLDVSWPEDMQNPDDVAMAWDKDGQRHIYAFKNNKYREYTDFNRPYSYKTTDGLNYSICAYFETNYPSLAGLNCSAGQSSNNPPVIAPLINKVLPYGKYFSYDISASDADSDALIWSIDLDGTGTNCLACNPDTQSCSCSWLNIGKTNDVNIKRIYGTSGYTDEIRTVSIKVTDTKNISATKQFSVNTRNESSVEITSTPNTVVNVQVPGDPLQYQYDVEARDNQDPLAQLEYSWSGQFPVGMDTSSINTDTGLILGTPTVAGNYQVIVKAVNPIPNSTSGPKDEQSFTISITDQVCGNGLTSAPAPEECDDLASINVGTGKCDTSNVNGFGKCKMTYCGDDVKQIPNGRGWNYVFNPLDIYSKGFAEQCDDGQTNGVNDQKTSSVNGPSTPDAGPCIITNGNIDTNPTIPPQDVGGTALGTNQTAGSCRSAYCGDGYFSSGIDAECDDGNRDNTDQCDTSPVPSERAPESNGACKLTFCGDRELQTPNGQKTGGLNNDGNEECDDGTLNNDNTDQCDTAGTALNSHGRCTKTYCGDGAKQNQAGGNGANGQVEDCDDGNTDNTDTCDTFGTAPDKSGICAKTFCGDNVTQNNPSNGLGTLGSGNTGIEECDDGGGLNFTDEGKTSIIDPTAPNVGSCVMNKTAAHACVAGYCGDGYFNTGEGCDDGNADNTDRCNTASCTLTYCGDGIKQDTTGVGNGSGVIEGCDETGAGCKADCSVNAGWVCTPNCLPTYTDCLIVGFEACADGDTNQATDGSSGCSAGVIQTGWACNPTPTSGCGSSTIPNSNGCWTTCGDGIRAGGEACDDGNTIDGNGGCNAGCTAIETGWNCTKGYPGVDICSPICGDGYTSGNACDDHNSNSGDGCSYPACTIEAGYLCTLPVQDSVCTKYCVFDDPASTFDGTCVFQ